MRTHKRNHSSTHRAGRSRRPIGLLGGVAIAVTGTAALLINLSTPAAFAVGAPINLRTTASYSVLGGETVTNTGLTTLDGDLGTSPGTAITGFPPGIVAGTTRVADAAAQAKADLVLAYDEASSRATTQNVAGDLVGRTLVSGVYTSAGPLAVSGTLTLDAQGDPNAVFVFQAASTLITASSSRIALTNGASSCNVFWQVGSSAILGTNSRFTGTILALTSITATTNARVDGRTLARNGQVELQSNVFQSQTCVTSPVTSSPTPGDTGSGTPGTPSDSGSPTPGTPGGSGSPTPGTPGGSGSPTPGTPGGGGAPTAGTPGNGSGTPSNPAGTGDGPGSSSSSTAGPGNGDGRGGNGDGTAYDSLAVSGTNGAANGWIGLTALGLVVGGVALAGVSMRRRAEAQNS